MISRLTSQAKLSLTISLALVLQTFTFWDFFFYAPFSNGVSPLTTMQFVSQIAWVLLVVSPPVLLVVLTKFTSGFRTIFLIASIAWPISLILIRIILAAFQQEASLTYLYNYPIFVFSDIAVPVIYAMMLKRLPRTV